MTTCTDLMSQDAKTTPCKNRTPFTHPTTLNHFRRKAQWLCSLQRDHRHNGQEPVNFFRYRLRIAGSKISISRET